MKLFLRISWEMLCSDYYNTHEPQLPLLWCRSQPEAWITDLLSSDSFIDAEFIMEYNPDMSSTRCWTVSCVAGSLFLKCFLGVVVNVVTKQHFNTVPAATGCCEARVQELDETKIRAKMRVHIWLKCFCCSASAWCGNCLTRLPNFKWWSFSAVA